MLKLYSIPKKLLGQKVKQIFNCYYTCCLYGAALDGGEIHTVGRLKGWALNLRLFWALKWQRNGHLGPKNLRFQGAPLQVAREMDFHPNTNVQPHMKKNRYIGNLMNKRQEISGPFQRWFLIRG